MNETSQLFAAATGHHQAGRLYDAAQLYEQVLNVNPNHVAAWHLLGVTAWQLGKIPEAIRCIQRALELEPRFIDAHNNLGLVLEQAGDLSAAADCFRQAIALDPTCSAAFGNLGNVLRQLGNISEAISHCQRALELEPNAAGGHYNLGVAWQAAGNSQEAALCYRRAIERNPQHAEAYANLGLILAQRGLLDGAAACFDEAIRYKPDHIDALNNLGNLRLIQGKLDAAAEALERALAIQPNYIPAQLNLANVLSRQGKHDEACALCDSMLKTDPELAEAYAIRGDSLKNIARLPEAIADYRRVLELRSDAAETHSALVYALHFCPGYDPAAIYAEHNRLNEQHALPLSRLAPSHGNERDPDRRLRLGYVSPNFRYHCQALFTTPLLRNQNREQFEVFCYSKTPRADDATQFVRAHADHWRIIYGMTDAQVAELVRNDGIDILVDLTMHMELGSPLLFARKPAPVQVSWLAYPSTTGLTAIDYRLTDPYLDPPGLFDQYYSEESIRLPHSFWCYDPLTTEPAVNQLPAVEYGAITFGCLNTFFKLNSDVLRLWAQVMNAVDCSRLILLAPQGSARQWVLDFFANKNITAERISFVPFQRRSDYLATYHKIDIALETMPYNGHTTSLDSFWMGVPVPTIVGQTAVGRAGLCLLENLGLRELIAYNAEEFTEIVANLAADLPRLSALRAGLRERMERSPLTNAPQFTRDIEAAYRQMWRRWCEKQGPLNV